MKNAYKVVEVLGNEIKVQVVQKICSLFFENYIELFQQHVNNSLEQIEKRYGWLFRHLKEFDSKFEGTYLRNFLK